MEIFLIIVGLIVLAFILFNLYNVNNKYKENFCAKNNVTDTHALSATHASSATHALEAPNIPTDWRCKFRIGGKYCKSIAGKNIADVKGKYVFPKPELLYDGIYKSNRNIKGNIETQKWNLIGQYYPIEGKYAANRFYHVPESHLGPKGISNDPTIFYGDWNILDMKNRNEYELDKCNNEKYNNYLEGIVYLSSGVGN